jgi:hypothetical protein
MNTQKIKDTEPQTNASFLLDDDSELTYVVADVNITRPGSFDYAGIEAQRIPREWDISDAYNWN